jgi:hypothetical protein
MKNRFKVFDAAPQSERAEFQGQRPSQVVIREFSVGKRDRPRHHWHNKF